MGRINLFKYIVCTIALLIIARLFYWEFIANLNSRQSGITDDSKIPAPRGEIIAKDNFPLATNQEAFLVYGQPNEVEDAKSTAQKIAPFLISEKFATAEAGLSDDFKKLKVDAISTSVDSVEKKLSNKNQIWVQLARKVTLNTKNKIESLNIKGIGFEKDAKRLYPESSMAAQLLGFVASNKYGDDQGYFGLEGYYDNKLQGTPGQLGQETDPMGIPILVGKYRPVDPKPGSSIATNIDRTIQFIVEQKLKESTEKFGAKTGTVIVEDPKTGHILALATYPNYNPNFYDSFDDSLYKNPAVADTYEPGSTFKLVTMAAGLDSSVVEPYTKCTVCDGPRKIGGYEISTWNNKYFPNSTMTDVIEHSDNTGMTFVADKLGLDNFLSYIKKFGFGKETGIDLQEESSGVIRNKKDWHTIDLATASFGQGIAVTPIQMVQAVGAIANGGKLISPKIATEVVNGDSSEKIKSDEFQVINPKTAAQITEMMVNAVEKGEAKAFAPAGYRIAGKTGTAQIPVSGHYDPNKTIASFVGFAPADDPAFVMLVLYQEPSSSIFGAETAAPTFFSIAVDIFNYLGIPPQK